MLKKFICWLVGHEFGARFYDPITQKIIVHPFTFCPRCGANLK